jgi:hypothetical protein
VKAITCDVSKPMRPIRISLAKVMEKKEREIARKRRRFMRSVYLRKAICKREIKRRKA